MTDQKVVMFALKAMEYPTFGVWFGIFFSIILSCIYQILAYFMDSFDFAAITVVEQSG